MYFRPKETLEEIASDWLQESSNPFPVFVFNDESFQLLETPDASESRQPTHAR